MSTTKKVLTAVGLVKAPKTTLFLKKPVKAAAAWVALAAGRKVAPKGTKRVVKAVVGTALAAAVVAPLAAKAYRESAAS